VDQWRRKKKPEKTERGDNTRGTPEKLAAGGGKDGPGKKESDEAFGLEGPVETDLAHEMLFV